jgi:signal transduction histidine kinase
MRNATAFATFAAAEKDLTLDLTVPDPGCVTFADAKRLRQVVVNLVANALKFTQVGGVGALAACPEASDQESGRFRIAATDTDRGIPEAEQERIHERFTQVDDPVTRQFGGVGLGLAISRSIVEEMGGEITVESRLGQGTTFRVEAPVRLGQMRDLSQI